MHYISLLKSSSDGIYEHLLDLVIANYFFMHKIYTTQVNKKFQGNLHATQYLCKYLFIKNNILLANILLIYCYRNYAPIQA